MQTHPAQLMSRKQEHSIPMENFGKSRELLRGARIGIWNWVVINTMEALMVINLLIPHGLGYFQINFLSSVLISGNTIYNCSKVAVTINLSNLEEDQVIKDIQWERTPWKLIWEQKDANVMIQLIWTLPQPIAGMKILK